MLTGADAWVGLQLDSNRYKVAAKLGEGGMGFVYRARDRRLGCDVVIKAPRPEMLADAEFRQRFAQEIRALVQLSHPHVVKVSDVGKHEGVPFAVMQYLPGGSLEQKRPHDSSGSPMPADPKSLADWLPAVADALDFIHSQGFVHRDVKPANILFDAHGHAYISDFGVAKTLAGRERDRSGLTGVGMVLGTPEYMAPELVMGKPFDGKVDQYALAITVYEILSGSIPFEGPTGPAVLVKQTTETVAPLTGVSPALAAAVARALAKDPEKRFATCKEFARAVTSNPVRAKRQTVAPETRKLASVATPLSTPAPKNSRQLVLIGVAAGVLFAGLAAFASFWALSGKRDSAPEPLPVAAVKPAPEPKVEPAPSPPPKPKVEPAPSPPPKPEAKPAPKVVPNPPPPPEPKPEPTPEPPPKPKAKTAPKTIPKSNPRRPTTGGVAGQILSIPSTAGPVRAMAVSTDGQSVVVATPGAFMRMFDLTSGQSQSSLSTHRATVNSLAFMADKRVVIAGNADGTVRVYDLDASRDLAMLGQHTKPVMCVAAAGNVAVSGGDDGPRGWDIRNGGRAWFLPQNPRVTALALSSNGEQVYMISAGAVSARNGRNGWETKRYGTNQDPARCLALNSQGTSLAVGCTNGKVLVYDVKTSQSKELTGHSGVVTAVAISPDGKRLLSGGDDKTVRLWDLTTGKEVGRFEGHTGDISGVAILPGGRHGVSASTDATVRVLNLAELPEPQVKD